MNSIPLSQCAPLSSIQAQLQVGQPLPVNVRNSDGTLLLARGQVVASASQLRALMERGSLVDVREAQALQAPALSPRDAPRDRLPGLWNDCLDRVGNALRAAPPEDFTPRLEEAAKPLMGLIERDPDLAIFQILHRNKADRKQGVARSVHAGIAATMAAEVLGWSESERLRAFKAALTMNIAMLDMQGQLAIQMTPLTPLQREVIEAHPSRGRRLLEESGITDALWLRAIEEHHERPDGSGYPRHLQEVHELAELLHTSDCYTAMLSVRATREALPSDAAARRLFASDPKNPHVAATIKAFGLYPPGAHVRLASGEVAIVLARGPAANAPLVASLINSAGMPMAEPLPRDTTAKAHAVVAVVGARDVKVRVPQEKLVLLTA